MAINLRITPQKPAFQVQNPVENMMKNPVDDFLAPFKQNKSEMEQKLAELSGAQAPKSMSQDINESNWGQFQGEDPNKPNYQPQSLIDYFRTGKTTSELMADGTIPSTQISASENPFKAPAKSTNPYEGAPQFVQDFGNFYMGTNPDDPTTSGLYQALAPNEDTIANMGQAVKDTAENLQTIGQDITSTTTEVGNWIQNKAPGYEQAKAEGRLLSMEQVKSFLDENPEMSEDQLISAMADLEKEGFMFEGYNDLNNQEAGTSMGRDLLGAGVKGIGSMFGMGSEALGGTMEGAGNIAEGETGLGVSQIAGQVPNVAMTGINAAFPGAGALASGVFSTDTGQEVMQPVMDVSQNITEAGLSMTNLDPNSEEYQNYLKGGTGTIPLLAGAGIAKGVKAYAPEIKAGMGRAGEFVKENAPIVGENIMKAGEKVGDVAGKVGEKISEKSQKITNTAREFIDKEIIGIDKAKKSGYQSNPFTKEYFEKVIEQTKSAEGLADIKTLQTDFVTSVVDKLQPIIKMKEKALSEDSPIYKQIREMPTMVDSAPIIQSFTEILKKNGLGIDETGQVYRAPGTAGKTLNQADVAKVNQLYQDIVADSTANGGKLTTAQTLDARKSASKLAKYDASTTTDGQGVIRAMRSAIDKSAKDGIEGLREIDKNFVDKLEAFQDATRELVYKQGENKGEFISNFNSKIKNLMNDRNSPLRARLDEIMPDISARIEAINYMPELYKAFNRKLLQSRFADGAVGGGAAGFLAGMSTGPLGAIAGLVIGGIVGLIVEGGLTKFKEARLRAIVSKTSSAGKARLDAINKKFAKNEALSKSDEQFLKDLQKKIALALVKEKMFPKEGMKLLAGPSGLDLSADVVNVKPITAGPSQARQRLLGNTRRKAMSAVSEGINRPEGVPKTKSAEMYGKEAIDFKEKTAAYDNMVKDLKRKIASDTLAARLGGTGNTRVETAIKGALDSGKIDQATAFDIIMEIIDDSKKAKTDKTYRKKYSYIDSKKLEDFLNELYTVERKPQSWDEFVAEGAQKAPETKPVKEKTAYQMFDEINRAAFDRRFSADTVDGRIAEFKKLTGKDPLDVTYSDFTTEGAYKSSSVAQKAENGSVAVIEKPQVETQTTTKTIPEPEVVKTVEKPVQKSLLPKPKEKSPPAKVETPVKAEIETLPKEISTYDEAKVVGPKRIAPDRIPHQQLTPEEGITKLVEKLKEKRDKNSKYFGDALVKMDAIMEKYGASLPARTEANLKKYPTLKEDTAFKKSLEQYAHAGTSIKNIRDRMEYLKDYWKFDESKMEQYREAMAKDYVNNVKDDISKGYKYPEEVLAYDKSFKTAVNSRERYEKGLRTSFGVDDARIVFDEVDKIGAGMKRQDGKAITPEQIADIKKGVTDFAEVFDLDMKRIANNERWVYVHLNGKNPFLKTNASGLYRPDAKAGGVSISVGGDETVTIMKDGKMEVKKTHTTMAHELGHALDFQVKRKLFDSSFIFDRKLDMNKATDGGSWYSKYLRKPEEIVARMIEQYVGVKKGNEAYYEKQGFWKKSIFDNIEKDIEKAIDTHYGEYKNSKEKK